MTIKFLTPEVKAEQEDRKIILIAKLWQSRNPYSFLVGLVGIKKLGADWNFNEVSLHPGDRIFVKPNKWRRNERNDPHFLVYVENNPRGSKLYKKNQKRLKEINSMKEIKIKGKKNEKFLPPHSFSPKISEFNTFQGI